jgi:arsenical pump membrane protein
MRSDSGRRRLQWVLAGVGSASAVTAAVASSDRTQSSAAQSWPAFVLVAGLLLIGFVAHDDGIFSAVGDRLARLSGGGISFFVGAAILIGAITALLNLDTSVVFLTPVLIYAARSRGEDEAPFLYGCILLSNAGSLFLPGSNLTNLITLSRLHVTGGEFFRHMWLPAIVALVVTAAVVSIAERRALRVRTSNKGAAKHPSTEFGFGVGLIAVVLATVLIVVLRSPALPVFGVGVASVAVRTLQGRLRLGQSVGVLGLPVLIGLFGLAVALGTLGREWSGPIILLGRLDAWGTAGFAALSAVLVNNLPAASLLAARPPSHPFSLLIGLNLGPNLFVTGSLAWFLWLRSARVAGADPSLRSAARIGLVAVPLAIVAAVGALLLIGGSQ